MDQIKTVHSCVSVAVASDLDAVYLFTNAFWAQNGEIWICHFDAEMEQIHASNLESIFYRNRIASCESCRLYGEKPKREYGSASAKSTHFTSEIEYSPLDLFRTDCERRIISMCSMQKRIKKEQKLK